TGQFQDPAKISGRTYLFLLLSGLGTGASWLCYFRALKLGNAAQVAPIDKLSVVMVAILGVVFLGEKLSAVNWLGVLLVAGGAIVGARFSSGARPREGVDPAFCPRPWIPACAGMSAINVIAPPLHLRLQR